MILPDMSVKSKSLHILKFIFVSMQAKEAPHECNPTQLNFSAGEL